MYAKFGACCTKLTANVKSNIKSVEMYYIFMHIINTFAVVHSGLATSIHVQYSSILVEEVFHDLDDSYSVDGEEQQLDERLNMLSNDRCIFC